MKEARKWYLKAAEQKHPFAVQKQNELLKNKLGRRKWQKSIGKKFADVEGMESMPWELIISFLAIDSLFFISSFMGWNLVYFIILNICVMILFFHWILKRKRHRGEIWNRKIKMLAWSKIM